VTPRAISLRGLFSLENALDLLFAALAVLAGVAVLQTFLIGRHYIIPSLILALALLLANLAWYGLRGAMWAKRAMFWAGVLTTAHLLFALFWAQRYRELLGSAFEPVCVVLILLLGYLTWQYARRNRLLSPHPGR
jgi:hypothetical protein